MIHERSYDKVGFYYYFFKKRTLVSDFRFDYNGMVKKKQGFAGERTIELSQDMLDYYADVNRLSQSGYFTRIGFYPEARHQFFEQIGGEEEYILIYCINGYGTATINHHIFHLSIGDFFLIPAHTSFSYYSDSIKPWTVFWFFFKGATLQEMVDLFVKNTQSNKGYLPYNEERVKLFNLIYACLERGYGKQNLTIINMCLLNLISSLALITPTDKIGIDNSQTVINGSIQFMKENSGSNLKLEQMAANANLSVSHFSSIFKQHTGVPPVNYYINLKIQKACELLKYSKTLIKEIAFKLGILDVQYFSRLFTKTMGMSPQKYRKLHT